MLPYLAGPFVCSHLQTDGCVVHGGLDLHLVVVQVPPCAVRIHTCLAGTLVGPHLEKKHTQQRKISYNTTQTPIVPKASCLEATVAYSLTTVFSGEGVITGRSIVPLSTLFT